MSLRSAGGTFSTSTATIMSARPRRRSKGSGLVAPPSMRTRLSKVTGRSRPGMAIEAASAGRSAPDVSGASSRRWRSVSHDGERYFKLREIRRDRIGQKLRTEFLRIDLRRVAEAASKQIGDRACTCRDKPPHCLAAVVGEADDMAADVLAAHSRRIRGTDKSADRGAGDGGRLHAHLVERLDYRDMRQPARAAATEREREGFHLRYRLKRPPPGARNPSALAASGRTRLAFAAATVLVAVPSRTRPTMPCRIAARRKKL